MERRYVKISFVGSVIDVLPEGKARDAPLCGERSREAALLKEIER